MKNHYGFTNYIIVRGTWTMIQDKHSLILLKILYL